MKSLHMPNMQYIYILYSMCILQNSRGAERWAGRGGVPCLSRCLVSGMG